MALDRKLKAALDAEALNRSRSPETTKLEGLLWALAEHQRDPERHARVGQVAGVVGTWAAKGHNVNGPEALIVLEAALKAAGVRV